MPEDWVGLDRFSGWAQFSNLYYGITIFRPGLGWAGFLVGLNLVMPLLLQERNENEKMITVAHSTH